MDSTTEKQQIYVPEGAELPVQPPRRKKRIAVWLVPLIIVSALASVLVALYLIAAFVFVPDPGSSISTGNSLMFSEIKEKADAVALLAGNPDAPGDCTVRAEFNGDSRLTGTEDGWFLRLSAARNRDDEAAVIEIGSGNAVAKIELTDVGDDLYIGISNPRHRKLGSKREGCFRISLNGAAEALDNSWLNPAVSDESPLDEITYFYFRQFLVLLEDGKSDAEEEEPDFSEAVREISESLSSHLKTEISRDFSSGIFPKTVYTVSIDSDGILAFLDDFEKILSKPQNREYTDFVDSVTSRTILMNGAEVNLKTRLDTLRNIFGISGSGVTLTLKDGYGRIDEISASAVFYPKPGSFVLAQPDDPSGYFEPAIVRAGFSVEYDYGDGGRWFFGLGKKADPDKKEMRISSSVELVDGGDKPSKVFAADLTYRFEKEGSAGICAADLRITDRSAGSEITASVSYNDESERINASAKINSDEIAVKGTLSFPDKEEGVDKSLSFSADYVSFPTFTTVFSKDAVITVKKEIHTCETEFFKISFAGSSSEIGKPEHFTDLLDPGKTEKDLLCDENDGYPALFSSLIGMTAPEQDPDAVYSSDGFLLEDGNDYITLSTVYLKEYVAALNKLIDSFGTIGSRACLSYLPSENGAPYYVFLADPESMSASVSVFVSLPEEIAEKAHPVSRSGGVMTIHFFGKVGNRVDGCEENSYYPHKCALCGEVMREELPYVAGHCFSTTIAPLEDEATGIVFDATYGKCARCGKYIIEYNGISYQFEASGDSATLTSAKKNDSTGDAKTWCVSVPAYADAAKKYRVRVIAPGSVKVHGEGGAVYFCSGIREINCDPFPNDTFLYIPESAEKVDMEFSYGQTVFFGGTREQFAALGLVNADDKTVYERKPGSVADVCAVVRKMIGEYSAVGKAVEKGKKDPGSAILEAGITGFKTVSPDPLREGEVWDGIAVDDKTGMIAAISGGTFYEIDPDGRFDLVSDRSKIPGQRKGYDEVDAGAGRAVCVVENSGFIHVYPLLNELKTSNVFETYSVSDSVSGIADPAIITDVCISPDTGHIAVCFKTVRDGNETGYFVFLEPDGNRYAFSDAVMIGFSDGLLAYDPINHMFWGVSAGGLGQFTIKCPGTGGVDRDPILTESSSGRFCSGYPVFNGSYRERRDRRSGILPGETAKTEWYENAVCISGSYSIREYVYTDKSGFPAGFGEFDDYLALHFDYGRKSGGSVIIKDGTVYTVVNRNGKVSFIPALFDYYRELGDGRYLLFTGGGSSIVIVG